MIVHLAIHAPKPEHVDDLMASMHRFAAGGAGQPGLQEWKRSDESGSGSYSPQGWKKSSRSTPSASATRVM